MLNSLRNQIRLVTGGPRGIGRAICRALDAEGARLIVHYHRNWAAAEEMRTMLLQSQTTLVQAGLASMHSISGMVELLKDTSFAVRVNNAGVWKPTPLGSTSETLLN